MKVCFRIEGDGEVLAVFPESPTATKFVEVYSRIGQHQTALWEYVRYSTRRATPDEYADLLAELIRIGYKNLEVGVRLPSWKTMFQSNWVNQIK